MTSPQLQNDVFKFVSVRPPEAIAEEAESVSFIRYAPEDGKVSKFIGKLEAALQASSSKSDIKSIAGTFVLSDEYIADFRSSKATMQKLYSIYKGMKADWATLTTSEFISIVEGIFSKTLAEVAADKLLASVKESLWNSMYAAFFNQDAKPHDKFDMANALRICHAVEALGIDNAISDEELKKRLRAKILISKDLIQKSKQKQPGSIGKNDHTKNDPKKQAEKFIAELELLRDNVLDLELAKLELVDAELKSVGSGKVTIKRTKNLAGKKSKDLASKEFASAIFSDTAFDKLSKDAVKEFSTSSKTLFKNLNLDLEKDSVPTITKKLNGSLKDIYFAIQSIAGAAGIDAVTKYTKYMGNPSTKKTAGLHWTTYSNTVIEAVSTMSSSSGYDNSIFSSLGTVQPIGIGDLEVVKETLMKYDTGEVAYIENVLKSESMSREYRRLDRTEETYTTSTETESSEERDLQTTTRYELQQEAQKTIESDQSLTAGASVSASYGPVSVSVSAEYSTGSSSSESSKTATNYAKDIVDRSVSSITQKVKEERSTTTITEIEETSTHGFDNTAGTEHIVGIYRWVDKYYEAQVYNYGQRLMFEFIVPEPAAFYLYSQDNKEIESITAEEPEPLPDGFTFESISTSNYASYAALYNVSGIEPPPEEYVTIAKAFSEPYNDDIDRIIVKEDNGLTVPDGYTAYYASRNWAYTYNSDESPTFDLLVGTYNITDGGTSMSSETGTIPVAIHSLYVWGFVATVKVKCQRTEATLDEWRISTYDKIVAAYEALKSEYDSQVSAAADSTTLSITSRSSDSNRSIEKAELKKGCITLLTNQHYAEFDAMTEEASDEGYPEINVSEAMSEGPYIQFFEQAFEWDQMTYLFYPYFWGKKSRWVTNSQLEDSADSTFTEFLRAGAARVLVPVQAGSAYEEAAIHYIETGEIWNGGETPTIDDPLYISIVDEIQASEDMDIDSAVPDGDPWDVLIPTSLVMLQSDATLPDWTDEGGYDA
jgi:hypothetical protein